MNVVNQNPSKLIVWCISDGRAGHDAQSKGLVRALSKLKNIESYNIPSTSFFRCHAHYLLKQFPAGAVLPDPDLIIGAGHKTHLSMLCAKRARGGKTILLMTPSLPIRWFDFCLIPAHDKPETAENIIVSQGALNMITPSHKQDPSRGLMLVGGKSRHYHWDNSSLIQQIKSVLSASTLNWQITDSRRTPEITRESLQMLVGENIHYVSCQESGPDWLPEQLQYASTVWTTADSISMVYEAITAGAAVGVFYVPSRRDGRMANAIEVLAERKMVTRFSDWNTGHALYPARPPLNEAERCAELLLNRLSRFGATQSDDF